MVDLDGIAIADIAAGGWHSIALTSDGQIYVWGRGEYGRLGVGDRTGSSKLRPHPVRGLEGFTVVQVRRGRGWWGWGWGWGWGWPTAAGQWAALPRHFRLLVAWVAGWWVG